MPTLCEDTPVHGREENCAHRFHPVIESFEQEAVLIIPEAPLWPVESATPSSSVFGFTRFHNLRLQSWSWGGRLVPETQRVTLLQFYDTHTVGVAVGVAKIPKNFRAEKF